MAESREVQALQKISAEVDESQIKVICSTQCIKAQAHLTDKLKKKAERLKETYSFIARANMKLQSEITQAQQEIQSLIVAHETIKMANVELKKECLLAEDKKIEVIERVKNGEKKYEDLWLESKARFESLPFVQNLLKAQNEVRALEQQMNKLDDEKRITTEKIKAKTEICIELDRKRILELAEFMVNERPKYLITIKAKSAAISDLKTELNNIGLKAKADRKTEESTNPKDTKGDTKTENNWLASDNINDTTSIMPKLQLSSLDFDVLSVKLDEAKTKASTKTPVKNKTDLITHVEVDVSKVNKNIENSEEYSSFFNMPSVIYEDNKPKNYAKMKLINILEDIKIDANQAFNMMAKVNPDTLQPVDSISVGGKSSDGGEGVSKNKDNTHIVSEEIEEIDLTTPNTDLLLFPPTQFQDTSIEQGLVAEPEEETLNLATASSSKKVQSSQAHKTSQEDPSKKKVTFDLPNSSQTNFISNAENLEIPNENDANETQVENSQLDVSAVSDDGFAKLKDMIMKKHNLDLSPQFVYAKNVIAPLNLQKSEDRVVTSKFFQDNSKAEPEEEEEDKLTVDKKEDKENNKLPDYHKEAQNKFANSSKNDNVLTVDKDFNADVIYSPKRQKMIEIQSNKPAIGFLFSHDAPISESLDASMNTTGYEDGDEDYPRCIDSSLLLSPKADIPMPMSTGENVEVLTQDVPNFLSGLRKTGLSFFGHLPSSEPKPGSSAENQGGSGFSFNFSGEEKKSRGGLFSMFQ